MATCPNKNLESWKSLEQSRGADIAFYLWDKYQGNVPEQEYLDSNVFYSSDNSLVSSKASPAVIQFAEELLKRMGVDLYELSRQEMKQGLRSLAGYKEGQIAYGIADTINKVAWILEGKADVALTEETMHFVVAIIRSQNPKLFNRLMSRVNSYQITRDVISNEGYRKQYQTPEGKPDVPKLKEEAVGKVLAEYIINALDGKSEKAELVADVKTWWQQILDWFSGVFAKHSLNIARNPFEEVTESLVEGTFQGTADQITDRGVMYSLDNQEVNQQSIYDSIRATSLEVSLVGDQYINSRTGKPVAMRVSELKKLKKRGRPLERNEAEKKLDDQAAEWGTKGHADLQDIFNRYIDDSGFVRRDVNDNIAPLEQKNLSQMSPSDNVFYKQLENNFRERILSLTKDLSEEVRFIAEQVVYDPNRDLAGTIDFMAIHTDGKVDIYDWKFMGNIDTKTNDIISFKKEDFESQLNEYRKMLTDVYNVPEGGKTRILPIRVTYHIANGKRTPIAIDISPVDLSKAQYDYQLPYAVPSERTGNKAIDDMLDRLYALYDQIKERDVIDGKKFIKAEQMNQLLSNIRHLQVKGDMNPALNYVDILVREADDLIETFNNKYKDVIDLQSVTDEEISNFAGRIVDSLDKFSPYLDVLKLKQATDDGQTVTNIDVINSQVSEYASKGGKLQNLLSEFNEKYLGTREGVANLLMAEKEYKGLRSLFRAPSQGSTTAGRSLYNIVSRIQNKIVVEKNLALIEYEKMSKNFLEWASAKGLDQNNMFDLIYEKSPSSADFDNQRADTIQKQFFKDFREALDKRDSEWIHNNIDINTYIEEANKQKELEIAEVSKFVYDADPARDAEKKSVRISEIEKRYNFTNKNSSGFFQQGLSKFPTEKWLSDKYKQLRMSGNEPALAFYEFIGDMTNRAANSGMIQKRYSRTFLPYIRKANLERLIYNQGLDKFKNPVQSAFDSITINDDDYEYGYRNPLTGKVVYDLKARFTSASIGANKEWSTNLLANVRAFNEEIIRYENLSTVHDSLKGLLIMEKNKNSIQTDRGKPIINKKTGEAYTQDNNEQNYRVLEDIYNSSFLGIRQGKDDYLNRVTVEIPKNWQKNFNAINEKLGFELMPTDVENKQISVVKVIEGLKSYFQLKIMGFNLAIPLSNLFGGAMQAHINSGDYYDAVDFNTAGTKLIGNAFENKEGSVLKQLLDVLEPYVEKREQKRKRVATANKLGDLSLMNDIGLFFTRSGRLLELNHSIAMLSNAIVIDGKVVNVNKYLNKKYEDKWNRPFTERQKIDEHIKAEKKKLIEEKGLISQSKIVNEKLVLPEGIKLTDPSILSYRNTIVNLSKQILGATSPEDLNRANQNTLARVFLVFKNWIAPLLEPRLTELKFSEGTERWEYGRWRAMTRAVMATSLYNINTWRDLYVMNDKGVAIVTDMLQDIIRKKEKDLGRKLKKEEIISTPEFIALYQTTLKNAMKSSGAALSMVGILVAASAYWDDEEEDPLASGYSKFARRMVNKVTDEILFFANPVSAIDIANAELMPPLSLIYDAQKVVTNVAKEGYGFVIEDDDILESTYPTKYILRMSPLTNNLMYYTAIASPDFAEALDVRITSQARSRR